MPQDGLRQTSSRKKLQRSLHHGPDVSQSFSLGALQPTMDLANHYNPNPLKAEEILLHELEAATKLSIHLTYGSFMTERWKGATNLLTASGRLNLSYWTELFHSLHSEDRHAKGCKAEGRRIAPWDSARHAQVRRVAAQLCWTEEATLDAIHDHANPQRCVHGFLHVHLRTHSWREFAEACAADIHKLNTISRREVQQTHRIFYVESIEVYRDCFVQPRVGPDGEESWEPSVLVTKAREKGLVEYEDWAVLVSSLAYRFEEDLNDKIDCMACERLAIAEVGGDTAASEMEAITETLLELLEARVEGLELVLQTLRAEGGPSVLQKMLQDADEHDPSVSPPLGPLENVLATPFMMTGVDAELKQCLDALRDCARSSV